MGQYILGLSKTFFQREEKHKNECKQASYSIKDPNNILSSQKHLLTRECSIHDPKHRHTLNKFSQFYISKTSQDSLVSTY